MSHFFFLLIKKFSDVQIMRGKAASSGSFDFISRKVTCYSIFIVLTTLVGTYIGKYQKFVITPPTLTTFHESVAINIISVFTYNLFYLCRAFLLFSLYYKVISSSFRLFLLAIEDFSGSRFLSFSSFLLS